MGWQLVSDGDRTACEFFESEGGASGALRRRQLWWGVKGEIDEKGFLAGYDKPAECDVVADAADRPAVACGREFEGVTCSGHRGVSRAGEEVQVACRPTREVLGGEGGATGEKESVTLR